MSSLIRFIICFALICSLMPVPRGQAQSLSPLLGPLSKLTQPPSSSPSSAAAPPVYHAPVVFNSETLFQVYGTSSEDAQDRAALATLRLQDALKTLPAGGTVRPPAVSVDMTEASVEVKLGGQPLLTVTQNDATANDESTEQVAASWAQTIQNAFQETLRERQPQYLRWAIQQALLIILLGILIHLLIWIIARRWLGHPGWPIQTLIWIWVIRVTLHLFPETRPINQALWSGAFRPLTLFLMISLAAAALSRIWAKVLMRLFPPLPEHLSAEERTERTIRRRATLADVARVTGIALIWIIALLIALTWSGVNLSALLASAGLIGLALSLAAQDSLKDLVAGINILADDRYGIGDTISVGVYEGQVERLTLRITQLRDLAGRLITLPNRNIAEVANLTARWAQVDFKVSVSYYDDLQKALSTLQETAEAYVQENPQQALDVPHLLGVDSFNDSSITLRLLIRTPPGDQWTVARDLRVRVKNAFDQAGLVFMNSLYVAPAPQLSAVPPAPPAEKEENFS